MATVELNYTNNNTITITLASLTNGSRATSSTIDNSSTKFLSADVQVKIRTGAGTSATGTVTIYFIRSVDGGTTFDDSTDNAEVLGVFNANTDTTDFIFSVDTTVAGTLPSHWKIAVKNDSGATFNVTSSNFYAKFAGKKFNVV